MKNRQKLKSRGVSFMENKKQTASKNAKSQTKNAESKVQNKTTTDKKSCCKSTADKNKSKDCR